MPRSHLDGKPYYCKICGIGFGEFMACDAPYCKLEQKEKAILRRKNWLESLKRQGKKERK